MNNYSEKMLRFTMIFLFIFLVLILFSFIDKDILFFFKETRETTGVMKNIELDTNEIIVEYEIDGVIYTSKVHDMSFEKGKEIGLFYNVENYNDVIEKEWKIDFVGPAIMLVIIIFTIMWLKFNFQSKYFYNSKNVDVVDGEIFEILNQDYCKVCLKVNDSDKVYYLISDINLKPILEKLNIKKLPIYIKKNYYIVDTRPIEEKIEIIKEKIIFS